MNNIGEKSGRSNIGELKNKMKLFEEKQVRAVWDEDAEKYWFSIMDILAVLTEQQDNHVARKYRNKLKQRLKGEENETVTNCHQLKMKASDGKMRLKKFPTGSLREEPVG